MRAAGDDGQGESQGDNVARLLGAAYRQEPALARIIPLGWNIGVRGRIYI
ncbi:MAG: hypothetical protein IPL78_22260 [Chloroflexi bacterium]|nr:hypothetical protein [Chloroflexota bacterium]